MATINVTVYDSTEINAYLSNSRTTRPCNRLSPFWYRNYGFRPTARTAHHLVTSSNHKNSGRQVQDNQTLAEAQVKDGDILRLQPEITAGMSLSLPMLTIQNSDLTRIGSAACG